MSGITFALNTAKDALAAQQLGLDITGNNIANVNTEGYSKQTLPFAPRKPVLYGGILVGSGVDTLQVQRSSDQFIEDRLRDLKSDLASFTESSGYINIMEGFFNEDTDSSVTNLMSQFWNSWHDLANNPTGSSERVIASEKGSLLADRLTSLSNSLSDMKSELGNEISGALPNVNAITSEIGKLNQDIVSNEVNRTANDQRDKRTTLVSDLGKIIGINSFEQPNGSLTVTTADGFVLVDGVDSYSLSTQGDKIMYETPYGGSTDITDKLKGGSVGGWKDIRDNVASKYISDLNEFSKQLVWAVNQVHSQGAGQSYFDEALTGTYASDDSGLLSTLGYGDKIDNTGDFAMWIKDDATATPQYSKVDVDMGISDSPVSNWQGADPAEESYKYAFTVTNGGIVGADGNIAMSDGPGLSIARTGTSVSGALDSAIAAQTLSAIGTASGTQTINVADGGDSERSAKAIADALSTISGVSAHASDNSAYIDISAILPPAATSADEHDQVSFDLVSGGKSHTVSFEIGASVSNTRNNFLSAVNEAVQAVNGAVPDLTIDSGDLLTSDRISLRSESGENIGIENFNVGDAATITMDNFANFSAFAASTLDTSAFAAFNAGDSLDMTVQGQSFTLNLAAGDTANAAALSAAFVREFNAAGNAASLAAANIAVTDNGGSFTITSTDETATTLSLAGGTGDTGSDGTLALSSGNSKTTQNPGGGGTAATFEFTAGGTDTADFSITNKVRFDVTSGASVDNVIVDLTGVDTTDQAAVANAFYRGITAESNLNVVNFTPGTDTGITLVQKTPDVALTFDNTSGDLGNNGSFDLSPATGTTNTVGNQTLSFAGGDQETFTAAASGDTINFDGATILETAAGNDSAVKTGTLTITMDPGIAIQSDIAGAAGGIFNLAANIDVPTASTVMTLGGTGGFVGFDPGDRVSFDIDGNLVNYFVAPGDDTDPEFAAGLQAGLTTAGLDSSKYSIVRVGNAVSILKKDGTPIQLTNFADDKMGGGSYANLSVMPSTMLDATHTSASSRLLGQGGVIEWKKFDTNGRNVGTGGTINVDNAGTFQVEDGFTFDIAPGSLVAGNTFTINTNTKGAAAPLDLTLSGKANSVLDTYKFQVESGGEIGADDVKIKWTNNITEGEFTLEGQNPAFTPVKTEVDGMNFQFDGGTLFTGDRFTLTTDSNGNPTTELPQDWHWTMDSFKDQFNRQAVGVKASVTKDNTMEFTPDSDGFKLDNFTYSGSEGFSKTNVHVSVNDYQALDKAWPDLVLERNELTYGSSGGWGITGITNPGYKVDFTPLDGFDMDNGFYVNINGSRAITVNFDSPITDNGSMAFDISPATGKHSFAFSDDKTKDSGLAAALGVNTFFTGQDAATIGVNSVLSKEKYIGAGQINGDTGELSLGDNRNALSLADQEFATNDVAKWDYETGTDPSSKTLTSTVDEYYHVMVGSIGLKSQSIQRSKSFGEVMVNNVSEQRDSVSAVSLDEEMINLMKYQHAYTVAAKLLSVADEMLSSLIAQK